MRLPISDRTKGYALYLLVLLVGATLAILINKVVWAFSIGAGTMPLALTLLKKYDRDSR